MCPQVTQLFVVDYDDDNHDNDGNDDNDDMWLSSKVPRVRRVGGWLVWVANHLVNLVQLGCV